jgi:hypothetical protein
MDDLRRLAARLEADAAAVTTAAAALDPLHVGARSFGADAPGAVGRLGRALHRDWTAALAARECEARDLAARVSDVAASLAGAAAAYAEADDVAGRRLGGRGV